MVINFTPVYYHAYKTGGTYITNCILKGLKEYFHRHLRTIKITQNTAILAQLIVLNKIAELKLNKFILEDLSIPFESLKEEAFKDLTILAVVIKPRGFLVHQRLLDVFFSSQAISAPYPFITLREPFAREQSLYYYLRSSLSLHETNHNRFKSLTFEEHIKSDQLKTSSLIANLLNLPDDVEPTEKHFETACSMLKTFRVYDVKDAEKAIQEVFLFCYNLENIYSEIFDSYRHENSYKKIKFEDLSSDIQAHFISRNHWDIKLYNYFVKDLK